MRAIEFTNTAQQNVAAMKQQAKAAQKRAKEAALRLKLRNYQQRLAQVMAQP
ncbi:hypothetical protein [Polynucleobacter sinensis]|uniref:hypothetical protein n=1 Tax=Polynucleobacter sinensis TaxID=1743157 RepID=UPI000B0C0274|nr:hypothetical protein [Polynucleobacter sinensis]